MSKEKSIGQPPSWGPAKVLSIGSEDRIFGKLCEVIEAMGINDKQEEAVKNLIRKNIYEVFNDAAYISVEKHNEIRGEYYKQVSGQGNLPNPSI